MAVDVVSRALVLLLLTATPGLAQRPVAGPNGPDFLFEPPRVSASVRGSWNVARAGSDWYGFVTRHLTLESGDFRANGVAADLGVAVTRRVEAVIGFDFHQTSAPSEYRDYVDNNRLPILQETRLRQMTVTGSARVALIEPGRRVGQFVWVPRRLVPYAGGGIGGLRYNLEQTGDFVDFLDFSVFRSIYRAEGWTRSTHVLGGAHVRFHRRLAASFEGRYVWASARLGRPWVNFEPLDLSGIRIGTGINVIF